MELIIAVVALLIALATALRQDIITRRGNALAIVVDLFREFRTKEFKESLRFVRKRLHSFDPDLGYARLPDEAKAHVQAVSHFYDNLGLLVAEGFVSHDLVVGFIGHSIEGAWDALWPFLRVERERRSKSQASGYQAYFEDLVVRIQERPQSQVHEKLRKLEHPNDPVVPSSEFLPP